MMAYGVIKTICGIPTDEALGVLRDYKSGKLRCAETVNCEEHIGMMAEGVARWIEKPMPLLSDGVRKIVKRVVEDARKARPPVKLNDFAKEVHAVAVAHGWWERPKSFPEIVALCHSELSEALEADRDGKPPIYCGGCGKNCTREYIHDEPEVCEVDTNNLENAKPCGAAVELADCILRILDYCAYRNIDIEKALRMKHKYNEKRPYKNGGKRY